MRTWIAIGLLCVLAVPTSAQAPRVKSGYEVKGPGCWIRLDNGRIRPISCHDFRFVFKRAGDGGGNGDSGSGSAPQ